ncbi:hypothetical protein V1293_005899 [Bradyrhizobium sp. AZCC 1693]
MPQPAAVAGPILLSFAISRSLFFQAGRRRGQRVEDQDFARPLDRAWRNAVLAGNHHPIAGPDLQRAQIMGSGLNGLRELPVAPRRSDFDERRVFRRFLCEPGVDFVHPRRQALDQVIRGDAFETSLHDASPR